MRARSVLGDRKVDLVPTDTGGNLAGAKSKVQKPVERDHVDNTRAFRHRHAGGRHRSGVVVAVGLRRAARPVQLAVSTTSGRSGEVLVEQRAVAWAIALVIAIYLVGYATALPLFMLTYFIFGYPMGWKAAILCDAAIWLLTYPVIELGLGVHLAGERATSADRLLGGRYPRRPQWPASRSTKWSPGGFNCPFVLSLF